MSTTSKGMALVRQIWPEAPEPGRHDQANPNHESKPGGPTFFGCKIVGYQIETPFLEHNFHLRRFEHLDVSLSVCVDWDNPEANGMSRWRWIDVGCLESYQRSHKTASAVLSKEEK